MSLSSARGQTGRHRTRERRFSLYPAQVARLAALIAVTVGVAIVGFSPNRWDEVILVLPRGHGLHAHDVVGVVLVAIGVMALWRGPRTAAS